jgi:hypothetical protein
VTCHFVWVRNRDATNISFSSQKTTWVRKYSTAFYVLLRIRSIRTNQFRSVIRCIKLLRRMNCGRLWEWEVHGSWPGTCPVTSFIISGVKYSNITNSSHVTLVLVTSVARHQAVSGFKEYFFSPWTWVLNRGKLPAYRTGRFTLGRRPRYPLHRPHRLSADFGGDLNLHPLGIEPLFLRCPVRGLFTGIYRLSDPGSHISLFFDTDVCGVVFGCTHTMILTCFLLFLPTHVG